MDSEMPDAPPPSPASPQHNLTPAPQLHRAFQAPATTFHRFLELPKEIQIQIYKDAINAIPILSSTASRRLYICMPPTWGHVNPPFKHLAITSPRHARRLCALPTDPLAGLWNITQSCVLAREVVMLWWREEVDEKMEEIHVGQEERCSKKRLLEVLDEFIDELKGRSRTIAGA